MNWTYFVAAIAAVETGGRNLTGDGGLARGPLQIRQCVIDDVNRVYSPQPAYTLADAENASTAALICQLYLCHYMQGVDGSLPTDEAFIKRAARKWNGGPHGHVKPSTAEYGERVWNIYHAFAKEG